MTTLLERIQTFTDGRRHLWESKINNSSSKQEQEQSQKKITQQNLRRPDSNIVEQARCDMRKQAQLRCREEASVNHWWRRQHSDCANENMQNR